VELLAWRERSPAGVVWHDVTSADVQEDVKDRLGDDATPKDFRTWHATVMTARALAAVEVPSSQRARRRVTTGIVRDVAEELGNTPAVARGSYIDPRLWDLWERGRTIGPTTSRSAAERAVLELLS
jgi:DNA topoisomerase-1